MGRAKRFSGLLFVKDRDLFRSVKFLQVEIKADQIKAEHRRVTGHLAVFNNIDHDKEFFVSEAFDEQLEKAGGSIEIPFLWQHNRTEPIGKGVVTKDSIGLKFVATFTEGVKQADEAFALIKDRVLKAFSVGFNDVTAKFDEDRQAVALLKASVKEGSIVTFPANELATISEIKTKEHVSEVKKTMGGLLREAGYSKGIVEAALAGNLDNLCETEDAKADQEIEKRLKSIFKI